MASSRCPRCSRPVRYLLIDDQPVLVDPAGIGTISRTDVVFDLAIETEPHPGGWVRHDCEASD